MLLVTNLLGLLAATLAVGRGHIGRGRLDATDWVLLAIAVGAPLAGAALAAA